MFHNVLILASIKMQQTYLKQKLFGNSKTQLSLLLRIKNLAFKL